ncbi:hypothetical protein AAG906_014781 [Vitis piasezkii]
MLLIDVLLRANLFPLQHKVQRRGAILEALFRISEGYFFGPHHLIMASLLHFEEKVHQKKLQRADGIPLLFPRLLCQILEHLGYPEEPRLERRRHCREDFSLDKWHHLVAYFAPQGAPAVPAPPELPQMSRCLRLSRMRPHLLPLQHPPQYTCPRLYILLPYHRGYSTPCLLQLLLLHPSPPSPFLLRSSRLSTLIANEHRQILFPADGHYSCTQDRSLLLGLKHTTILHRFKNIEYRDFSWA